MTLSLHISSYLSNLHLQNQGSNCQSNRKNVAGSLQKCIFWLNSLVSNRAHILTQVSPLFYGVCNSFFPCIFFPDALVPNLLHSRHICNLLSFMYILVMFATLDLFETDNCLSNVSEVQLKPLRITEAELRNRRGTSLTPFSYQNENQWAEF